MLFVLYWDTTASLSSHQRLEVATRLRDAGLFASGRLEIVRWEVSPDGRDTLLVDAESEDDFNQVLDEWRAAAPGCFELAKDSPFGTSSQ
ncbi:MAG: hypothetical protein KJO98_02065 [Rhodothermia bacterium]|nr:hypothetical protein [Rhodothermia bacterium]